MCCARERQQDAVLPISPPRLMREIMEVPSRTASKRLLSFFNSQISMFFSASWLGPHSFRRSMTLQDFFFFRLPTMCSWQLRDYSDIILARTPRSVVSQTVGRDVSYRLRQLARPALASISQAQLFEAILLLARGTILQRRLFC